MFVNDACGHEAICRVFERAIEIAANNSDELDGEPIELASTEVEDIKRKALEGAIQIEPEVEEA